MRINRVVLENYGLYCGRNEIDLIPRQEDSCLRSIILIGGMNGAGKTTLLDGIRLALYGKKSVGGKISEKKYQEHLSGLIHRTKNILIQFNYARVGVEFDLVFRGNLNTYYVQRSWSQKNGSGVQESLQVYKRDISSFEGDYNSWPTLSDLEPEYWQAFVDDVVPERLSRLFFFDGEKIESIADDISGDVAIAESIRNLLGLDTVDRLKADLSIIVRREIKQYTTKDETIELDRLGSEVSSHELTLEELTHSHAEIETAILGIEAEIKRLERRLQEQGGAFAQGRSIKKSQQTFLETSIQNTQRMIRLECEGLFPLSLCPRIGQQLREQIEDEYRLRQQAYIRKNIYQIQEELVNKIKSSIIIDNEVIKEEAISIIKNTVSNYTDNENEKSGGQSLLGLSEAETIRIIDWLRSTQDVAAVTMYRLCSELEASERELQEIRRQLLMVPDETILSPLLEDIAIQNQLLGQKKSELKALEDKISSIKNDLAGKIRELDRIQKRCQERSGAQSRITMIGNVQKALDKYLERLTKMKVDTLRQIVTECFNDLSRKGDLLHDISINPYTFEVKLHDRVGHTIAREKLSAGEKQILAIAILWGLAKTSGRPLPVIIDTPLGRLDSDHRMNLVHNYFPHAGHQVILLSTDTEVDKNLFLELKPHISHCYHLAYNKEECRTYPHNEYFWKEQMDA